VAAPTARLKLEEPHRVFFNEARVRRTRLRFHLRDGRQIEGAVRSFGTYTLDVETSGGARMLLFKHA
jgi:sRNA-binding regulator protein Hfq